MADTLTSLGFELNGNTLTVPSWRGDCTMLADIAEECARFWGYNKIEATDIRGAATQGRLQRKDALCPEARHGLPRHGLYRGHDVFVRQPVEPR